MSVSHSPQVEVPAVCEVLQHYPLIPVNSLLLRLWGHRIFYVDFNVLPRSRGLPLGHIQER
jgi:hypothetical protein